jgi:hypothetical protein
LEICNCLIDSLNLLFAEGSGFFVQDLLEILELIAEEVANLGGGLTGDLQLADLALHVMHLPSSGLSSQHLFGFLLSVGRVFLNESHDLFELSLDGDISTHRLFSISHHHSEDQFLLILGESEEKVIERDPLGIFTSSRDILVQVLWSVGVGLAKGLITDVDVVQHVLCDLLVSVNVIHRAILGNALGGLDKFIVRDLNLIKEIHGGLLRSLFRGSPGFVLSPDEIVSLLLVDGVPGEIRHVADSHSAVLTFVDPAFNLSGNLLDYLFNIGAILECVMVLEAFFIVTTGFSDHLIVFHPAFWVFVVAWLISRKSASSEKSGSKEFHL